MTISQFPQLQQFLEAAEVEASMLRAELAAQQRAKEEAQRAEARALMERAYGVLGDAGEALRPHLGEPELSSSDTMFAYCRASGELEGLGLSMTLRHIDPRQGPMSIQLGSESYVSWELRGEMTPQARVDLAGFLKDHMKKARQHAEKLQYDKQEALSKRAVALEDYAAGARHESYWASRIEAFQRLLPDSASLFEAAKSQRLAALERRERRRQLDSAARVALEEEEKRIAHERERLGAANALIFDGVVAELPACQPLSVYEITYAIHSPDGETEIATDYSLDETPDEEGYYQVISGPGQIVKRRYMTACHITERPKMPLSLLRAHYRAVGGRSVRFQPTLTVQDADSHVAAIQALLTPLPDFPADQYSWKRDWMIANAAAYDLTEDDVRQNDEIAF